MNNVNREALLKQFKANSKVLLPEWTGVDNDNDPGVVLLKQFAALGDMLLFYRSRSHDEAFCSTAQLRENLISFAKQNKYDFRRSQSSIVYMYLERKADIFDYTYSKYDLQFIANYGGVNLPFINIEDITIPSGQSHLTEVYLSSLASPGQNYVDVISTLEFSVGDVIVIQDGDYTEGHSITEISGSRLYFPSNNIIRKEMTPASSFVVKCFPVYQAEVVADKEVGVFDGSDYQTFLLPNRPIVEIVKDVVHIDVEVLEGTLWQPYSLVDTWEKSNSTDKHFKFFVEEEDFGFIQFGNGEYGYKPSIGSKVRVSYYIGGGEIGNVSSRTITRVSNSDRSIKKVFNPFGASRGADKESIEELRTNIPIHINTKRMAVTEDSFGSIAELHSEVIRAKSEINVFPVVDITVITDGILTYSLSNDIKTFVESKCAAGYIANIKSGIIANIDIDFEILVDYNGVNEKDRIEKAVVDYIDNLFSDIEFNFNTRVYSSQLIQLVMNNFNSVLDIDNLNIEINGEVVDDIIIDKDTYLYLNSINVLAIKP